MDSRRRRSDVLDYILGHGSAQIDELMTAFGVSRMTVHRDLDDLEHQGFVRKIWGGVTASPSGLFESNFRYRVSTASAEKEALAAAALAHIQPGQSLLLDDSSTIAYLADRLEQVKPITVVTNSVVVLERLGESDDVTLIMLGGRYSRNFRSFLGLSCEQAIGRLHASVLFCSASAIAGTTVYHQDEQVVKVKRAMMAAADHRILMVDHHKFGKTALNHLADLAEFDLVLTTRGIDAAHRSVVEEAGVTLKVVPLNANAAAPRKQER